MSACRPAANSNHVSVSGRDGVDFWHWLLASVIWNTSADRQWHSSRRCYSKNVLRTKENEIICQTRYGSIQLVKSAVSFEWRLWEERSGRNQEVTRCYGGKIVSKTRQVSNTITQNIGDQRHMQCCRILYLWYEVLDYKLVADSFFDTLSFVHIRTFVFPFFFVFFFSSYCSMMRIVGLYQQFLERNILFGILCKL